MAGFFDHKSFVSGRKPAILAGLLVMRPVLTQ
jgi:hypothetical protein